MWSTIFFYNIQWSAALLIYNEDDVLVIMIWSLTAFSNYKFASEQREAVNRQILFVNMFMCPAVWKIGRNQSWKRRSSSLFWYKRRRLYYRTPICVPLSINKLSPKVLINWKFVEQKLSILTTINRPGQRSVDKRQVFWKLTKFSVNKPSILISLNPRHS